MSKKSEAGWAALFVATSILWLLVILSPLIFEFAGGR